MDKLRSTALFLALLAGLPPASAQEAIVTLRSTVTGNREQPRVMYIVPWQQPGSVEFEYVMESTIADELFVPIDREEFVRALNYRVINTAASAFHESEN